MHIMGHENEEKERIITRNQPDHAQNSSEQDGGWASMILARFWGFAEQLQLRGGTKTRTVRTRIGFSFEEEVPPQGTIRIRAKAPKVAIEVRYF